MKHRSIAEAVGKRYKTVADHKHMGLNNRICKDRAYFCKAHNVWLSEKDTKRKQCKNKPDVYMLGVERCPFLMEKKEI